MNVSRLWNHVGRDFRDEDLERDFGVVSALGSGLCIGGRAAPELVAVLRPALHCALVHS